MSVEYEIRINILTEKLCDEIINWTFNIKIYTRIFELPEVFNWPVFIVKDFS